LDFQVEKKIHFFLLQLVLEVHLEPYGEKILLLNYMVVVVIIIETIKVLLVRFVVVIIVLPYSMV